MENEKLPRAPQRTTPGFAFPLLDRSLRDCLSIRAFGKAEMLEVIDFFGQVECVYCGDKNFTRYDHLIAIRSDGETVIGNVVPACSRCDDSKQHLPYEDWMFSDAKYSPKSLEIPNLRDGTSVF